MLTNYMLGNRQTTIETTCFSSSIGPYTPSGDDSLSLPRRQRWKPPA